MSYIIGITNKLSLGITYALLSPTPYMYVYARCVCICYDPCRSTLSPECSQCLFACQVRWKIFLQDRLVPIVVNSRTLLIINNNLLPIEYFGNYFAYREIIGIGQVSIAITSDFQIVTN